MEKLVLNALNWDLKTNTSAHFFDLLCNEQGQKVVFHGLSNKKIEKSNKKNFNKEYYSATMASARELALLAIHITLEDSLVRETFAPSVAASAAIFVSLRQANLDWSPELQVLTRCTKQDILPCVNMLETRLKEASVL